MATQADPGEFELQEQLARIRKMGAEHDQAQAATRKLFIDTQLSAVDLEKRAAEIRKLVQDTEYASKVFAFQGLATGAGVVAAAVAVAKLFF